MNRKSLLLIGSLGVLIIAAGLVYVQFFSTATLFHDPAWPSASEQTPVHITLAGPLADANAEISGLAWHEQLVTIYEANGRNVNPTPVVHLFDGGLTAVSTLPFPTIEYRLTDATQPDEAGRFWAINYTPAQSIAKLDPASDTLFAQYGIGPTHASNNVVERLVEFQLGDTGISFSGTDPIQLTLLGDDEARNWEGRARPDERGFLLVTDKFPDTILAFVPLHVVAAP